MTRRETREEEQEVMVCAEKTGLPFVWHYSVGQARRVAHERGNMLWRSYETPELEKMAEVFGDDPDWPLKERPATVAAASASRSAETLVSRRALQIPGVAELLAGARDPKSSLSALRGQELILRTIVTRLAELHADRWIETGGVFAAVAGIVRFPPWTGAYCNMMPIRIGDPDSIPAPFRGYLPMLAACPVSRDDWGEIGYLTVDERVVSAGESHRRAGLHTEAPTLGLTERVDFLEIRREHAPLTLAWGRGYFVQTAHAPNFPPSDGRGVHGHFDGGLFMASNVDASCRVFNCRTSPEAPPGEHGDLEHLRRLMPTGHDLNAGTLVWLCDQAPHESLPLPADTPRQFFRLVTHRVDAWFADHSTPNPIPGIVPPPPVQIVHGSKFDPATLDQLRPTPPASPHHSSSTST